MKKYTFFSFLSGVGCCVLLSTGVALAQSPSTGGPTPGPADAVPLDGGASLLLAGGVALGLKKLRDRRRAG